MIVTVNYSKRTYGNSEPSTASEIHVSGYKCININIDFKRSQDGRGWNWATCGSVGGADIQMNIDDARAFARLILEYADIAENHNPFESNPYGLLLIHDGSKPSSKIEMGNFESQ